MSDRKHSGETGTTIHADDMSQQDEKIVTFPAPLRSGGSDPSISSRKATDRSDSDAATAPDVVNLDLRRRWLEQKLDRRQFFPFREPDDDDPPAA